MKNTLRWTLALALAVPVVGCKKESKPAEGTQQPTATAQQPQQVDTAAMEKAAEKWVEDSRKKAGLELELR